MMNPTTLNTTTPKNIRRISAWTISRHWDRVRVRTARRLITSIKFSDRPQYRGKKPAEGESPRSISAGSETGGCLWIPTDARAWLLLLFTDAESDNSVEISTKRPPGRPRLLKAKKNRKFLGRFSCSLIMYFILSWFWFDGVCNHGIKCKWANS